MKTRENLIWFFALLFSDWASVASKRSCRKYPKWLAVEKGRKKYSRKMVSIKMWVNQKINFCTYSFGRFFPYFGLYVQSFWYTKFGTFDLPTVILHIFRELISIFFFQIHFDFICLSDDWRCFWKRNWMHLRNIIQICTVACSSLLFQQVDWLYNIFWNSKTLHRRNSIRKIRDKSLFYFPVNNRFHSTRYSNGFSQFKRIVFRSLSATICKIGPFQIGVSEYWIFATWR